MAIGLAELLPPFLHFGALFLVARPILRLALGAAVQNSFAVLAVLQLAGSHACAARLDRTRFKYFHSVVAHGDGSLVCTCNQKADKQQGVTN